MKIAIDIDKTLFDCKQSMVYQILTKIEKLIPKTSKSQGRVLPAEEIKNLPIKYRNLFGKMGDFTKYEQVDRAVEIIKKFASEGHSIAFLSSRPNMRIMNQVIINWLEKHDIPSDFVVINCADKAGFCKSHGFDVLIDDGFKNCKKTNDRGIPTVYLNTDNKKIDKSKISNKNIFHVAKDWKEVESKVKLIEQSKHSEVSNENKQGMLM